MLLTKNVYWWMEKQVRCMSPETRTRHSSLRKLSLVEKRQLIMRLAIGQRDSASRSVTDEWRKAGRTSRYRPDLSRG